MRIKTEEILTGLDGVDMTSNILSAPIWLGHIANAAIQLVFTGTPNGAFKLQGSVDEANKINPASTTVTNWTDIASSSQSITASGDHLYELQNIGYTFVRVVWTDTSSGTSEITSARMMVKGV